MVDRLLKDKSVGYASVLRKPGSFAVGDFNRLNLAEAQKRKMHVGVEDNAAFTAQKTV